MTFILVRIILLVLLVTEERITFNTITSICIGLADEDSCIINNNTNTCCLGRLLLSCKLGAHLFADCIMDSEFDKDGVSNWGREFEKQVRFPLWYLRTRNPSVIKSLIKPLREVTPPTLFHPYPPKTKLQITPKLSPHATQMGWSFLSKDHPNHSSDKYPYPNPVGISLQVLSILHCSTWYANTLDPILLYQGTDSSKAKVTRGRKLLPSLVSGTSTNLNICQ